ncbi:MAG: hypothetical protein AAB339_03470, partial [Elusimicrobiota bacterium]
MAERLTLGDILLKGNVLSREQLEKARKHSEMTGARLGDTVVKLGLATEDTLAMAVSKMIGVPFASKENKILVPEKGQGLQNVIEERFARENALLPLFLDETVLAVALAEPENVLVLDNLKLMTGFDIQPFISTKSQIMKAIDDFYGSTGGSLIDKVMKSEGG